MSIKYITAFLAIITLMSCGQQEKQETPIQEIPAESTENAEITEPADAGPVVYDVAGKDTIVLQSGLKYILVTEGTGAKPEPGSTVTVHYTGYLTDGTKFDSSVDRGEPIKFPIGTGAVIKGWDEGLALLKAGSKARFIIPSELAYGMQGYPPVIPSDATLIFDVQLLE